MNKKNISLTNKLYQLPSTQMVKIMIFACCMLIISSCNNATTSNEKSVSNQEKDSSRPNVLVIVADDLGYSDIAPFGGNIETPVISQLAKEGMLFSDFHVLPTCSPTRSALLTGNDNHVAGVGIMSEMDYPALHQLDLPGYRAHLSDQVVTIPELLSANGYHTYMTGKWHLGEGKGKDPHDRGFEETFILGTGGGSHWNDRRSLAPPQHMTYTRNGTEIEPPADFYSSKNYTDSMIHFIDQNKADKKPFFAYLSYTAVHDPLHAPNDYIAKNKGKFDMGWDSLWNLRLENLQSLGIVPKNLSRFSKNPRIPKWNLLSKEQQKDFSRDMEVYAAMLEYLDMSMGRVIDYLKKEGLYDNTMIVFMSDNGANGATSDTYPGNADGKYLSQFNNKFDNRGKKGSYVEMGPGWAQASSSPYKLFKTFATEGGIKAPLMVKLAGNMKHAGEWNKSFVHVTDLMPTILELTGTPYPKEQDKKIHPLIGKSLVPVLKGDSISIHTNEGMGWELFEMKAYIKEGWKILRLPRPFGSGEWQLYDLTKDPAETTDLSKEHPEIKADLIKAWNEYSVKNNLYDHHGHYDSVYKKSYMPGKEND